MNRNGRSRASRLSLPLLLLLLLLRGAAAGEERTPGTKAQADPDVLQLRSYFDEIFGGRSHDAQRGNSLQTGRTFGHKRIQFMLMPMVYKMGVMMTMLGVLTVISLKGLMVGLVLLVLKLSTIIGKFYALWHSHGYGHGYGHGHGHSHWTPPQPVHVHLHNSDSPVYEAHGQAYHGWEAAGSGPPDESYYHKG